MSELPQFLHDCSDCVFLGPFLVQDEPVDLYIHGGHDVSVIARFSDTPSDYASMPAKIVATNRAVFLSHGSHGSHGLVEAFDRAHKHPRFQALCQEYLDFAERERRWQEGITR